MSNLLDWKDLLLATRSKITAIKLTMQLPESEELWREDSGVQSKMSPGSMQHCLGKARVGLAVIHT